MNSNSKMSADALLEEALRAVDGTSAGSDDFPMPKAAEMDGLPSPRIASPAGLPSPKPVPAGGLPSPKIVPAAGLPSPKPAAAGLPSPKPSVPAGGLPSPKIVPAAGLPSPKPVSAEGLPSPKSVPASGLPSPKPAVGGLPSPKSVPAAGGDGFPSLKSPAQDDFPSLQANANAEYDALEQAMGSRMGRRGTVALGSFSLDDDEPVMHQSGGSFQKGMENLDMDAPKVRLGNEPPSVHSGHAFANGFEPSHDFDNDSGLPLNDDPLGLDRGYAAPQPEQSHGSFDDVLGLFGDEAPVASAPVSPRPAAVTPVASAPVPPRPAAPVPPSPAVPVAPVASAPVPPMPVAPVPPVAAPAGLAGGELAEVIDAEEEAEGELFELDTIRKDGQGLARPMAEAERSKVVQEDGQKRKKKLMIIAGSCVAAIALLCVIGYVVLGVLDERKTEAQNAVPVVQEEKVVVSWDVVGQDRLFFYQMFNKRARERLKQSDVGAEERSELQGKLLLNGAFALVRYGEVFKGLVPTLDGEAEAASAAGSDWETLGAWAWGMMRGNEELTAKLASKLPSGDAFDELRATAEFAAAFAAWKLEDQTFAQRMDTGKQILKAHADTASSLPLAAWMHAETLNRLGRYEDAIAVLEKVKVEEEGEMFPSGVVYLMAQTFLKLDQIKRASECVDRLLKSADESEKRLYEKLRLTCDMSQKPWGEMSDVVKKYISDNKGDLNELLFISHQCGRVNRSLECRGLFSNVLDEDQRNLSVRKAYLDSYLASLSYRALIRPDGGLIRPQLEALLRVVEEGIVLAPEDIDLWKTKALVAYAQKDYETSLRAIDEVERGKDMLWFGRFLRELMTYETSDNANKASTGQRLKKFANDVLEPEESIPLAQALAYVGELSAAHQILERAMLIYPEDTLILDDYYENALALKDIQLSANILDRMRKRGALLSYYEYEYARLIEQLGDIDTALEKMVFLVDQTKNDPNYEFLAYVGELFLKQGKCDNALPYFTKALAVNPNDPRTRYNKGQCLYKNKKYDEALIEFNEAATQDETNHMYDLWIGQALAGLQQMSEAHRAFTAVIDSYVGIPVEKLSEQDVYILSEAHYFRAEIRKLQSRRSEARDDYLEALKFRSNERRYLTGYGIYLYENGNIKECIDTVTKIESLQAETMDSVLYFVRGLSRLKLNKPQEAVVDLEKARRAGYAEREESGVMGVREPAELYERLGYLYRDLGRKEEARQTLRLFLEKTTALSPSARREVQGELEKI